MGALHILASASILFTLLHFVASKPVAVKNDKTSNLSRLNDVKDDDWKEELIDMLDLETSESWVLSSPLDETAIEDFIEGSGEDLQGSGASFLIEENWFKQEPVVTIPLENKFLSEADDLLTADTSRGPDNTEPGTIYGFNGQPENGKGQLNPEIITIWLDLKTGKIVGSTLASLDRALLPFIGKDKMESVFRRAG